ncbi:MAG: hypothetical protein IKQ39_07985 [Oscillospiraceae bacterium]|nr:hypothetical protein [Oscillospiraceae bacterium]
MSVFFSILMRVIIEIPLFIFLFALMVVIPAYLLRGALQTLIGRPLGIGWMRVEGRVTEKDSSELTQVIGGLKIHLPDFQVAVYEVDGQEYRTALANKHKKDSCTLYVRKSNPTEVWQPKYPDVLTALVGTVLVLGLWAGLIYAGIRIIGIILN